jgi:maleate isomerase
MFGWRTRLGLLVPSSNSTNEPEFQRVLPSGVSLHTARLPLEDVTGDDLAAMAETAERATERLAHADVDVVAYGCTTGSLIKGHDYADSLEGEIEATADAPAVVTALSVERALSAVGAESVTVVTPYIEDLNEREREFLEAGGFEVTSIGGHGIEPNTEIGALRPEAAYRQAADAIDPDADAVFISCTNYRTFGIIERLEADLGIPVVTSNQATLWDALRQPGVDASGIELGRLFQS